MTPSATRTSLRRWLVSHVAATRELDPEAVDTRERFSDHGLDSLGAVRLVNALAAHLGRPLSPTLIWDHPTIDALAAFLSSDAPPAAAERESESEASPAPDAQEPIAVVGMACRFPKALDPEAFWELLAGGINAVTEVPSGRGWNDVLRSRGVDSAERAKVSHGGFLDEIAGFDPLFFGISPREAVSMDPQQRLMLELCWEAFEDAGIRPSTLKGSRTGVFAGAVWSDYAQLLARGGPEAVGQYTVTGYHHSIIANRVSYIFGLEGPSLTLDSACSSSLVAAHLACESLRRGESTLALAGGVNLNVLPESALAVSRFGALSQDGRCYTFDARANGYVRGEGGGVLVLKTLSRAIADGDPIYCVIRGSAVNNDGASNGLTAPSRRAQESVLRSAYRRAAVDVSTVQYVEAHGTGTPLGDPIEAAALGTVLGASHVGGAPLLIGSAKTNVGHLEAASGVVGLAKVALSIKHRMLPPSLNFEAPNPLAPLAELGLAVPTSLGPWPAPHRALIAGVSSFGMGGTNGHVVLEGWPASAAELLTLGAESTEALRLKVETRRAALASDGARTPLRTLCADPARDDAATTQRLAIVARSHADLDRSLATFLVGGASAAIHASSPSPIDTSRGVVFVFPGQGAHWYGMARSLLQSEPVFRATLERCDEHIRRHNGWSLIDELTASRAASRLGDIGVSPPAIISVEIALAAWWREQGIEPSAVVGQSVGEIAAAHVAGAISFEDAMHIVCATGRMIARKAGQGSSALVGLPWDQTLLALKAYEGRVYCSIQDSPVATVVGGIPDAVTSLLEELQAKGVFCPRVNMNVAAHSPMADSIRDDLFAALQGIKPRRGQIPLISEVTGTELDGAALDPEHWMRNLCDPALFSDAVGELVGRGHRVFVDLGPHAICKHSVEANLRHKGVSGVVLSSLRRDEDERGALLDTLGALHALGLPAPRNAVDSSGNERRSGRGPWLLPLSAKSPAALASLARAYRERLGPEGQLPTLRDVAYTASARRDHHPHRLAIVATTREEALEKLATIADGGGAAGLSDSHSSSGARPKVVFVFPGQGSQWLGMGRQLVDEEPVFRQAIEACDAAIQREAGFSVLAELAADEASSRLGEIDVVQPLLFAVEVALAALWQSWGVVPDAVVGHSMGEVAAAYVAGVLTLDDAAKIICRRSSLLRRVSGKGAMGLVELTLADARAAIEGHEARLGVAVSNGPRSTVLSGDPEALEEVLSALEARGVFCRRVKVDVASHSPQMDPLRDELLAALTEVRPREARLAMWSTVTGEPVKGPECDAAYWVSNLRAPVLFSGVTQRLIDDGHLLFVEQSPHPILTPAVDENLREKKRAGAALGSTRRSSDERRSLLEALGVLYTRGLDLDPAWKKLFPAGGRCVPLPIYPWQRERYWIDALSRAVAAPTVRRGHPLLGEVFRPANRPEEHYWEQLVSVATLPYLTDHQVQAEVVFPGTGYVEMALAAAAAVLGKGPILLEHLSFEAMLSLPADSTRRVQIALLDNPGELTSVAISSLDEESGQWLRHARATVPDFADDARETSEPPRRMQERCPTVVEGAAHYARMEARGIQYGPAFRGVERIWVGADEALGRVRLPEQAGDTAPYQVHPALLDACLQVATALMGNDAPEETFVPVAIDRVRVHRRLPAEVWVQASLSDSPPGADGTPAMDVAVVDDEGRALLDLAGLRLQRLDRVEGLDPLSECAFTISWRRKDLPENPPIKAPSKGGVWLVFVDERGTGQQLAALLRERGDACVEVEAGPRFEHHGPTRCAIDPSKTEDYRRLLRHVVSGEAECRGVVHLWSLDASPWETTTGDTLLADVRRGCMSALYVVQTLGSHGFRDVPRLVLVTRGAQAVGEYASPVAVAQAPLWGLGRTIAMEQPDLACTRVDLAPAPLADEAALLLRELLSSDGEDQIALREEGRLVARLERGDLAPGAPPAFHAQATYLITGGLGGLGISAARWMVAHGARHLLLVGRSEPSDFAREAILAMEEAGAEVRAWRADVSRLADVEGLLETMHESMPPLRGILHTAGVLDDRTLQEMSEEQLSRPMRPKVLGAWNLHTATRGIPLDFFVMYSSAAGILGSPGQGNYAAANTFLDALAHARAAEGLPAMSIQWGTFSEVGLAAAQENRGKRLESRGIDSFTPDEGTALLARLIHQPWGDLGLLRISVRQWIEFYPRAASAPFLTLLREEDERLGRGAGAKGTGGFHGVLQELSPAERRVALERHVFECLARVLHVPAERLDAHAPFRGYGMDSLMSLEIRNRLEASLGLRLSASLLFTYSTTASLVEHLLSELVFEARPEHSLPADIRRAEEPSIQFFELSEETALAMLDEKLLDLEDYLK